MSTIWIFIINGKLTVVCPEDGREDSVTGKGCEQYNAVKQLKKFECSFVFYHLKSLQES